MSALTSVFTKQCQVEIKELIDLIRLDDMYYSLLSDGIFPIDSEAIEQNYERHYRIIEISRKYGLK
ncbi:hypothetical protein ALQ71_04999 [Pseudomonas coronafaciens pv. striafaciens]|uniref:Uncharacterized protein n=1 Tax=Pseudomonas coronafaciens pv. coronafaciens TaxID=235275 RepID=A0AAE6QLT4_9PSED|nr:hypothetical protein GMO17_27490 [Pseudomonas coronafaciens pv. coronafaciens]QIQ74899.1 hypothetical protein HBB04_05322 [Pseudomonas coronafaciens]RMM83801.1 hypothetical protein ALQ71_04999 [Pseudomonas coronafaciens pv. striafaciens]